MNYGSFNRITTSCSSILYDRPVSSVCVAIIETLLCYWADCNNRHFLSQSFSLSGSKFFGETTMSQQQI